MCSAVPGRREAQLLAKPEFMRRDSESQLQSLVARIQCGDWTPVLSSLLKDRLREEGPQAEEARPDPEQSVVQEYLPRSVYRETLFLKMAISRRVNLGKARTCIMHVCIIHVLCA